MPYYNYRRTYWRRRYPRYRRFRTTFRRRRYRRRQWVRRRRFIKKKAKKITVKEWQPRSIRKCTVKGFLCLFQTQENRASYNFDMYEESMVPERLPGGGGFSIKNLSLNSIYQEHTMGHNIFTQTNNDKPLVRYKGCKIKFYQSKDVDYVCTYSNTLPLRSSMAMYNTMQPSIHLMQQHKIIVPSKQTQTRKRPYITKWIPPPSQMKSQWYFQHDICNIPLFMLRTSSTTLDHYYIGGRSLSTNITIYTLNTAMIQNRNWGNAQQTWWCRTLGTQHYFLYATLNTGITNIADELIINLIPLINTQDYQSGQTPEAYNRHNPNKTYAEYLKTPQNLGNPFYKEWIDPDVAVIMTPISPSAISQTLTGQYDSWKNKKLSDLHTISAEYSYIPITKQLRYNPYKDKGTNNDCYFLQIGRDQHGWDPTGNPDLQNENLPLWLLLFGYADFVKKTGQLNHIDTSYLLCLRSNYTYPQYQNIVPLSFSFIQGSSPYQSDIEGPDHEDLTRWNPTYQYQQEAINTICTAGPGTPRIPKGVTVEAKIKYSFKFKWGGDAPPMSTVTDPYKQPTFPIPHNNTRTTSLQNPATRPESYLYSFDERRGTLTKAATKRMQKDWQITDLSLLPTEPRHSEETTLQTPLSETSSEEEEEESLFQLLNKQRHKQQRLKLRILKTLQKLQTLE
nr:MAG: ORF1 [TTV-like mini virus]